MLGIGAAVLALMAFLWLELAHKTDELAAIQQGQKAYVHYHTQLLKDAREERDKEQKDAIEYRRTHPVGAVFLCKRSTDLPSRAPPPATSPSSGSVRPVHEGNTGVREERAGPDIGPLQNAFAASCESVSGDLREQQAVK